MKLVEVDKVEWVNKKSYSTVALVLQDRDYRILLRTNDGLEDWFELLEVSTAMSFSSVNDLLRSNWKPLLLLVIELEVPNSHQICYLMHQ